MLDFPHVKRKGRGLQDSLNMKLDYIINALGLSAPVLDISSMYSVQWEEIELFRGSKDMAQAFLDNAKYSFRKPLRLVKLAIHL